jgi:peptidoglycan/LPS O-acetylase OafA/YrhL
MQAGLYALLGVSNLYFYNQAVDYFGLPAEYSMYTHTWSLGVEEQFYLIFPTIFWLTTLGAVGTRNYRRLATLLVFLTIGSLAGFTWFTNSNPNATYFLMHFRFWELGIGSLVFLGSRATHSLHDGSRNVVVWVATLVIVLALFAPIELQLIATICVAICTAMLIGVLRSRVVLYRVLTTRMIVYIGLMSYSLYLWHWSVLTISRWTIGITLWTAPIQVVLIFALAWLSYLYLERPLRRMEWSNSSLITIGYGVTAVIACAVIIFVLSNPMSGALYAGLEMRLMQWGVETIASDRRRGSKIIWHAQDCILSSDEQVGKLITIDKCSILSPNDSPNRQFLVIGNSFSAAQFEMVEGLSKNGRGRVAVTSSWGASPVPELPNDTPWAKANEYYWSSVVPSLIGQLRRGDFVVMINDVAGFAPRTRTPESIARLNLLKNGLSRMAEELSRKGIAIVFQSSNPFMREANCTPGMAKGQWLNLVDNPVCKYYSRDYSIQRRKSLHDMLIDVQHSHGNFHVLDLYPVLCPGSVCRFYDDTGVFLYRDIWSHLSVEANHLSQNLLITVVDRAVSAEAFHDARGQ